MGSEWKLTTLSNHIDIKHGFAFKGEYFVNYKSPDCLVTPGNFAIGGGFKEDKFKYYKGPVPEDYILEENDLILTMTDLSKEADTLGYSAIVPKFKNMRLLHNQRVGLVKFKDKELDRIYLYFLLRSREYRHHVISTATGTTVKHTSPKKILSFEFFKPPKSEQERIGVYLLALERKIELNKKINQTLEQMAQAMFKSWFVDFDPVFDNLLEEHNNNLEKASAYLTKKGAEDLIPKLQQRHQIQQTSDYKPLPDQIKKEFPSDFQHHEDMGWIPEGWATGNLHDIAELTNERVDVCDLTINNYISTENMLEGKKGVTEATSLPSVKTVPSFRVGQILVSNIRPYFKKIWLATFDGGRSGDVLGFTSKGIVTKEYLYNFLYQDSFFDFMMLTSKGAKMPRGDKVAIMDLNIIIPTDILTHHYSKLVKDNHLLANNSLYENKTLQNIREILLPELISGNLKVG